MYSEEGEDACRQLVAIGKRAIPASRSTKKKRQPVLGLEREPSLIPLFEAPKDAPYKFMSRFFTAKQYEDYKLVPPACTGNGFPIYFLFECAFGYLLFLCHNVDGMEFSFESTEDCIKRYKEVFKFIAYYRFPTAAEALNQLSAIWKENPTKELMDFLVHNLPKERLADMKFFLTCGGGVLMLNIARKVKMPFRGDIGLSSMTRGLRTNICEFIDKKPADLVKAQRDLALCFSRKMCKSTCKGNSMAANSSSSLFDDAVVVVPHKFEGLFIAKGRNNDAICTKNLVPGEAVNGEELINVKNEDGTKTEYRVWDPVRSKLAAAIKNGVNNIWVKPGSNVLCMNDACGTTVSHLSDLVGPDGLVYSVSLCDAVVKMAEKRTNVIPIYGDYTISWRYCMLVSMVDAICADLEEPIQVCGLCNNAVHFLRAGGHFLVSTEGCSLFQVGNKIMIDGLTLDEQKEFNVFETIKLEQVHQGLVMLAARNPKLQVSGKVGWASPVQGSRLSVKPSALPDTFASVAFAAIVVGAATTLLVKRTKASQELLTPSRICDECEGSGICSECKGEGFTPKQLSKKTADKARTTATNMATRYTAGLPRKWSYCTKCSSARSCVTCGGRGRLNL